MELGPIATRAEQVSESGIRKFFQAAKPGSVSLALGQPDFVTPLHIRQAAITAIEEGKTGYTFNTGIPELREAICSVLLTHNNLSYEPDQLVVTAGAGEAIFVAMQALVDTGDRVLIPNPGFVSYRECVTLAGGCPDALPLDADLHLNVEVVQEHLDGARLMVLNSPANPTGVVEPEETIRAIVEYANDAGVCVLSDEVYEHFVYDAETVSAARFSEDVITVNATSKTYAMTGWRVGYLAGPDAYVRQCVKIHQYCQTCACSISQYAALAAYTGDQSCVQEMRDEYALRRDLLSKGLYDLGFSFPMPQGAFYLFVPMDAETFSAIIEQGVVIVPGDAFGSGGEGFARFSYAASRDVIQTALDRIGHAL